ncbi:helix-turn-helix domain-containing protein [Ornithinimicrobium cerasi]|uniref:helix-turn-helix domain-containing protein n=1 Tax=Ornithinimicrobium cerasi TaxID=2248773 RepID=UPI000EFE6AAC|nr:helix-turn-helix domain-containing protein [Ornithinimicrobium cerasi]
MAAPRRWTPADDDTLRALHAQGRTLHAIAGEMGRGKATISAKAAEMDPPLSWARDQVANATQAKVVDAKARRADVKLRLLSRAEHLLSRLEATEFTTLVPDGPGVQASKTLPFVPPDDEKALSGALASYLASYDRLEKLDGDNGVADAVGMLDKIADAIKAAAATMPDPA